MELNGLILKGTTNIHMHLKIRYTTKLHGREFPNETTTTIIKSQQKKISSELATWVGIIWEVFHSLHNINRTRKRLCECDTSVMRERWRKPRLKFNTYSLLNLALNMKLFAFHFRSLLRLYIYHCCWFFLLVFVNVYMIFTTMQMFWRSSRHQPAPDSLSWHLLVCYTYVCV